MFVSAQQDGFSVIFILAAKAHELSLGEAHHDHASRIVCRLYPSIKSHLLTEVKGWSSCRCSLLIRLVDRQSVPQARKNARVVIIVFFAPLVWSNNTWKHYASMWCLRHEACIIIIMTRSTAIEETTYASSILCTIRVKFQRGNGAWSRRAGLRSHTLLGHIKSNVCSFLFCLSWRCISHYISNSYFLWINIISLIYFRNRWKKKLI